jgi:TolB-like protein
VLVEGRCREADGLGAEAVDLYQRYLKAFGAAEAATAVRGQLLLTRERLAVGRARQADPASLPAAPDSVVAVLPLEVLGRTDFQALGRGLSAQIIADLLLLDRFRLVERSSLQAILDELSLAESPLMDSTTTPSFGRVVQAGRLVGGLVEIDPGEAVALRATVVGSSGEVVQTDLQEGPVSDLLRMQKRLVLDLARRLGHMMSQAEHDLILQNGTSNVEAFVAYSRGLELVDRGDYAAAAARFAEAYRLDNGFAGAREMLDASVGAQVMGAGGNGVLRSTSDTRARVDGVIARGETAAPDPVGGIVNASLNDVAPTQGEQATGGTNSNGPGSSASEAVGTILQPIPPPPIRLRLINVRVVIPGGGTEDE